MLGIYGSYLLTPNTIAGGDGVTELCEVHLLRMQQVLEDNRDSACLVHMASQTARLLLKHLKHIV